RVGMVASSLVFGRARATRPPPAGSRSADGVRARIVAKYYQSMAACRLLAPALGLARRQRAAPPGHKVGVAKPLLAMAVAELDSIEPGHAAPRSPHDGVPSGRIPFARRTQPRIEVGAAIG